MIQWNHLELQNSHCYIPHGQDPNITQLKRASNACMWGYICLGHVWDDILFKSSSSLALWFNDTQGLAIWDHEWHNA
jgi:hypothetical protein